MQKDDIPTPNFQMKIHKKNISIHQVYLYTLSPHLEQNLAPSSILAPQWVPNKVPTLETFKEEALCCALRSAVARA